MKREKGNSLRQLINRNQFNLKQVPGLGVWLLIRQLGNDGTGGQTT